MKGKTDLINMSLSHKLQLLQMSNNDEEKRELLKQSKKLLADASDSDLMTTAPSLYCSLALLKLEEYKFSERKHEGLLREAEEAFQECNRQIK